MTTAKKPQTKAAKVQQLLSRAKGASIEELCEATSWQPHSVRAFLTGLRKKNFVINREARREDGTAYRIASKPTFENEQT
ncbi:DUF3489 domain-containing protein [Parasphingorhabdus cellanae]|uniref:DUF3489 domain-containing protein n=1 Tax=Parasphingorhabdus cellanae TaxID=2806553 RepID=A0ABX7T8K7_9SPHN|nr:DUF3489 domain-containing protein [Parasphingorhabdus cellanae]QTD57200.1 DUF3489 domain-containing protein [Parasphingorhabdus cellanae]